MELALNFLTIKIRSNYLLKTDNSMRNCGSKSLIDVYNSLGENLNYVIRIPINISLG